MMILIEVWEGRFNYRIVVRTFIERFSRDILPLLDVKAEYRKAFEKGDNNSWYVDDHSLEILSARDDVKLNFKF